MWLPACDDAGQGRCGEDYSVGIVAHEDFMPTLLAAGVPDVKERLMSGLQAGKQTYKVHLYGYNMLLYFTGQTSASPRREFFYTNDDGPIVAPRYDDWKTVFLEQRAKAFWVWQEPFVELGVPKVFHLRRDPFERADEN